MTPIEVLMHEHRVIELVLDCLDRLAAKCEAGHPLDVEAASQAVEFFRVFADERHHGKEEDLLFPFMESKGFPRQGGPTGVMLHEHELGRRRVRAMADAVKEFRVGDLAGKIVFAEHARAFSALLREHIQKEDHCLFPMADRALSAAEQEELRRSFEQVDSLRTAPDAPGQQLKIAYALADRLGVRQASRDRSERDSCFGPTDVSPPAKTGG